MSTATTGVPRGARISACFVPSIASVPSLIERILNARGLQTDDGRAEVAIEERSRFTPYLPFDCVWQGRARKIRSVATAGGGGKDGSDLDRVLSTSGRVPMT